MTRALAAAAVLALAAGCTSDANKKACDNIFKVTSGGASAEKGKGFIEMCLQNQTSDRLGMYCKNPQEMLDCAASAADKEALAKCRDVCKHKECKDVVKAVVAKAGDRIDDATKESMLAKAEGDLGCKSQFDTFTFP